MAQIRYEGIRELARAFHELDREAYGTLHGALEEAGDVVRDDARGRFRKYDARSAAGFESRVRALGQAQAVLSVGQRLRKTTGQRPDWGALQVTRALLPARDEKLDEAGELLETRMGLLLAEHGL